MAKGKILASLGAIVAVPLSVLGINALTSETPSGGNDCGRTDYSPNDCFATIERASNSDWMGPLPDNTPLSGLSIPGTHDSMAVWGNLDTPPTPTGLTSDITKVQQRFNESGPDSLAQQLRSGVRSIDIRTVVTTGEANDPVKPPQLAIHHGAIYQKANFSDVLRVTADFLRNHPRETILMRLKLESGSEDDSDAFPAIVQKYRTTDPNGSILYEPTANGSASQPVPLLGSTRGKVVITALNGKNGGTYSDYGINPDSVKIQDDFEFSGSNASAQKFEKVTQQLQATADSANTNVLMVNYTSATSKILGLPGTLENGPAGIAHDLNGRLLTYLNNDFSSQKRTGILNMDYPGFALIDRIIAFNKRLNNPIPDLGSDPATFTVNTGSGSFTASQPRDSVATYVMKDGQSPKVTLTSADGSGLRYEMDTYDVTSQGSPTATVTVDPSRRYQTVDGFGGAMTSSAAALLDQSPKKDEALSRLFGTGEGDAGLSIARSPIGASDLQASDDDSVYTMEDIRGSFDATPTSGAARQARMLQAAKAKAGADFKLIGTPWTAPGWAKKGGKLTGNECGTDLNELDRSKAGEYAGYFARYVSAYDALGIRPWMVSMQNEPENCKTQMPTTLLNADDEAALSNALKSALPSGVGVLGWDHNWNDPDYVNRLIDKGGVDAIGYHCYDGTHYGAQTQRVKTLMTECSGFTDQSSNVAGNLGWEVANLLIGPMRNGSTGSVYWSLAQDPNGDPHLSTDEACQTCRGLLTMNGDGSYTPSQDFYFYAQFGRFVRPGAVRVDSNNTGDLSTIAFRDGDTTTLIVLNSPTHADGGQPGSSESDYRGKIVQWDNGGNGQNPSWLVGADGYRRWISDIATYQCLHDQGGVQDAGAQPGGVLDKYINLKDVWAVCGASVMGTNSELEKGTYIKSGNGAKLSLTNSGELVATDPSGTTRWTAPGTGDRLILQPDGNLVLYSGDSAVWATGTDGKGGAWLSIRDDGSFIVSTKENQTIWTSPIDASSYKGQIVQWDGDTADQKTSWQVGYDGNRRWIPDWPTFQCLHDAGEGNAQPVSSDALDKLPDLNDVWATCGADRLGQHGELLPGTYLQAGDYKLVLQSNGDLVLWHGSSDAVWSTRTNDNQTHYLELQTDGNLVLYTKDHHAVWSTGTNGKTPGWLVLGDDGSLRLYDSQGTQIWQR